jgi:tetratricopeptide (TPR) repeat protein
MALFLLQPHVSEAVTPKQRDKIEQLMVEVHKLFRNGDYKHSIPLLEDILLINPSDNTASRYLKVARQRVVDPICRQADALYLKADYEEAIDEWEKVLNIYPGEIQAEHMIEFTRNLIQSNILESMYELVEGFLMKDNFASAVNELEKILVLKPDDKRARELLTSARKGVTNVRIKEYYDKAELFMIDKKYDLAIETWNSILELDEKQEAASRYIAAARRKQLDSMYEEGRQLYIQGDYVSSRSIYSRIFNENPTDIDLKKIISRLDKTIRIVQKVSMEGKEFDMIRKALSHYISPDGNIKIAIAASWYAMQISPKNDLAIVLRNFFETKFTSVVVTMEPPVRDMDIIDQYLFAALNHIYEGRYDLAIQECKIVLDLQPENVLAYKRLGSAYFAIGSKDKAREAWEHALSLSPDDKELKKFIKDLK